MRVPSPGSGPKAGVARESATHLDAARAALVRAPDLADNCATLLRSLVEPRAVFRWYRRLMVLGLPPASGDIARKALLATAALRVDEVGALAGSLSARDAQGHAFLAAALAVGGRVDAAVLQRADIPYLRAGDPLRRAVSVLSPRTRVSSGRGALEAAIDKRNLAALLLSAGFLRLAATATKDASEFNRRIRLGLYGTRLRAFTHHWTFAIGHAVLLAFIVKGQSAGLFDFDTIRLWAGPTCNSYLMEHIRQLSDRIEVVPSGFGFADAFGNRNLEWVDGEAMDCFAACGVVADRAGDERGAILPRPSMQDPELARLLETSGVSPEDRIVTVHCREGGFRRNERHDLRNADIASFVPALRALAEQGYRVVRLGDPTMTPMPDVPGAVDYAHSPLKSPALDVQLPAVARFHIGTSSGLSLVPLLYGTPTLFLNWYPFDVIPWGRRNQAILKPLVALPGGERVRELDRCLRLGQLRESALLQSFGYAARDLAPGEVSRAVLEFAAAVDKNPVAARLGRNLAPVLMADADGAFHEVPADAILEAVASR